MAAPGDAGVVAQPGCNDADLPRAGHHASNGRLGDLRQHGLVQLLDHAAPERDDFRVKQITQIGDGDAGVQAGFVQHTGRQFVPRLDGAAKFAAANLVERLAVVRVEKQGFFAVLNGSFHLVENSRAAGQHL